MQSDSSLQPIGAPVNGIALYTARAVESLAVEAATRAARDANKGIQADGWACAVLIADAVLSIAASAVSRAMVYDAATAKAAEAFKAARIAHTGDQTVKGWPAFASARSTLHGGLLFSVYAPGMSKGDTAKLVKAAKTAAQRAAYDMAVEHGLIAANPQADKLGEAAQRAASREMAELRERAERAEAEAASLRDALASATEPAPQA